MNLASDAATAVSMNSSRRSSNPRLKVSFHPFVEGSTLILDFVSHWKIGMNTEAWVHCSKQLDKTFCHS